MRTETANVPDWKDAAAYAPLVDADRSLFAWEWLRRDPAYRRLAVRAASAARAETAMAAARFGLVAFENPGLGVPLARPVWRAEVHPYVLDVERGVGGVTDTFTISRWNDLATLTVSEGREHLLLSDGLRTIRLDGSRGLFSHGPARLRYRIEGLAGAEPPLTSLQRLLFLCRTGDFGRSLHPREKRAKRWILMLRTADALSAGANQRDIAEVLLSPRAAAPLWRAQDPSLRLRAQRLVRCTRALGEGAYLGLLAP